MKNILFIAGLEERYYYEPFIEAARDRGIQVYVFDPAAFPERLKFNISLTEAYGISGDIDVFCLDGETPEVISLTLDEIDVAWYIREGRSPESLKDLSIENRFRENESRAAFHSLLSVLPVKWVNKKETIDRLASNKLYQQLIATQCGITVSPTVVGNNPRRILQLSEEHDGLLLKSLGYIRLDEAGKYFLYSQRFSHEELAESKKALSSCPVFSQKYIEKYCEHRVMVIGDRVLSCRIDSQASEKTRIDWRHYDFDRVEHCAVELPSKIKIKLLSFMQQIGLQYGAIDLIEAPDGDHVFLEINPSGQWGWIHDLAGLPIPEAVAEMIECA